MAPMPRLWPSLASAAPTYAFLGVAVAIVVGDLLTKWIDSYAGSTAGTPGPDPDWNVRIVHFTNTGRGFRHP